MELRTKTIDSAVNHCAQVVGLAKAFRPNVIEKCAGNAPGASTLFDYCPGNGTRYIVMVADISGFGVALEILGRGGKRCFQVSLLNGGHGKTMTCGSDDFLHFSYVQDKLGVNKVDAVVLAELIGYVCGIDAVSCEQYLSTLRE